MRVVIGTRHHLGEDWFHVDADPTPLTDKGGKRHPVDLVCDARKIDLPDGCAEEVYSSECLEHVSWKDTDLVLDEWCRLVEPGGIIRVEVPDFLAACQQILSYETAEEHRAMNQIFFGGQDNQFDYHQAGLTAPMFQDYFDRKGWEIIELKRGWECGWLRVVARRPHA
jgi:predicted SAM-dependent methyltransferase